MTILVADPIEAGELVANDLNQKLAKLGNLYGAGACWIPVTHDGQSGEWAGTARLWDVRFDINVLSSALGLCVSVYPYRPDGSATSLVASRDEAAHEWQVFDTDTDELLADHPVDYPLARILADLYERVTGYGLVLPGRSHNR